MGKIRSFAQGHASRTGGHIFRLGINFKAQFSDFKSSAFSAILQMSPTLRGQLSEIN